MELAAMCSPCYLLGAFLGLLFVLYMTSQTFRFYTRQFELMVMVQIASAIVLPIAIVRPGPRNLYYMAVLLGYVARYMVNMDIKFKGIENIKPGVPYIMVCNHQSEMDIILLSQMNFFVKELTVIAKRQVKYVGIFGLLSILAGIVFVERSNPDKDRQTLEQAKHVLLDRKVTMIVFPEGTRNQSTASMLPFKKGGFHMAIQTGVEVLPVVISDCSSFYNNHERKFERGGKVTLTVLPPVSTKGMTSDDVTKLSESVRDQMINLFDTDSRAEKLSNK